MRLTLTYDGTTERQAEKIVPALEDRGLRATFFAEPTSLLDGIVSWRQAYESGHEIANGCLLTAASPDGSLPFWTFDAVAGDVHECDELLRELFPSQTQFSFAYPHGEPVCADGLYVGVVRDLHSVCRYGRVGMNQIPVPDLAVVRHVPCTAMGLEKVNQAVEHAIAEQSWIVLSFGELDGVFEAEHERILDRIVSKVDARQIGPFLESAEYAHRGGGLSARLV